MQRWHPKQRLPNIQQSCDTRPEDRAERTSRDPSKRRTAIGTGWTAGARRLNRKRHPLRRWHPKKRGHPRQRRTVSAGTSHGHGRRTRTRQAGRPTGRPTSRRRRRRRSEPRREGGQQERHPEQRAGQQQIGLARATGEGATDPANGGGQLLLPAMLCLPALCWSGLTPHDPGPGPTPVPARAARPGLAQAVSPHTNTGESLKLKRATAQGEGQKVNPSHLEKWALSG